MFELLSMLDAAHPHCDGSATHISFPPQGFSFDIFGDGDLSQNNLHKHGVHLGSVDVPDAIVPGIDVQIGNAFQDNCVSYS
mmetsp:Transcript_43200/g.105713  ORF Transcript_43200/g.105713 Transcript_43200/m.105713 type:complete len:81 (-) Transcript_43200:370-612(-)